MRLIGSFLVFFWLWLPGAAMGQKDVGGGKDHPLLTRMNNFIISSYEEKEFDSHEFTDSQGKDLKVEGRKYVITYEIKEGAKAPSKRQITRNYAEAIKKIGGSAYEYTENRIFLNHQKDGREAWVEVYVEGESYTLTIVEKGAMTQEVTAGDLLKSLNRDGRVALQIHFDFGKATIKPESQPVINQIAEMMKSTPVLKLSVEGHTDSVGNPKSNQSLSEQRAQAVMAAVVKQGIDPGRLSSIGYGQEKPVADNKSEQGRAKNRRVELVKK